MAGETDSGRPAPGAILARIAGAIGIATEGVAMSLGLAIVGIVLIVIGLKSIGAILVILAIPIALFFRDPERYPPRTENVVISGADGKVTDISDAVLSGIDRPALPSRVGVHVPAQRPRQPRSGRRRSR